MKHREVCRKDLWEYEAWSNHVRNTVSHPRQIQFSIFKPIFRHLLSKTTNREFCIHFHGLLFNNAFPNDTWCHLNFDLIKLLVEICPTILISDLYSNKSSENQTVLVCSFCNMQYLCSISLVKFQW